MPEHEQIPARFIIGIDLGTTNSAMTYLDTEKKRRIIRTFSVPQRVALNQVENRETLPSFHYELLPVEAETITNRLPFEEKNLKNVVGGYARDHGGKIHGRLVGSAKSWLSHRGVDRTSDLLPWQAAEGVTKISPVEATSRYLQHLRNAWNHKHPDFPMESQDLVITLPASFDEVARELTIRAAKQAGLVKIVLLEEPQAAFYSWVHAHAKNWQKLVTPGQKILVCDIGGGTTDLTLIRVRATESGEIRFHRVAVGEHLILGGDNLDLALAHYFESKLGSGEKITSQNWGILVRIACQVKEKFLSTDAPEKMTVHLPGSGSKLIGGSRQLELTREEVESLLVDGFMPKIPLDSKPSTKLSGIREMGLPYAADHAITKYLAQFLLTHQKTGMTDEEKTTITNPAKPDLVLFNGGMFESEKMQHRLMDVFKEWFNEEPILLNNERLDLAVSRGATYYGMVRRGMGEKINASLARAYYIGVESENSEEPMAICLLSAGTEVDQDISLEDRSFTLRTGEPICFPIHVSSVRLTDKVGELVRCDAEQMLALPPIRTVIKSRKKSQQTVTVTLKGRLTEIGTLELWCVEKDGKRRWQLNFDVRSATQTEQEAVESKPEQVGTVDEETWEKVFAILDSVFSKSGEEKPAMLMKRLTAFLELRPDQWPTSLLRRIGDSLLETFRDGRRKSPEHEARFLNLLGYSFRPGFQYAMDDWRVDQVWRHLQGNLIHAAPACRLQWWILWRRIAGGLSAGQQQTLADPVLANLRNLHKQATTGKGRGSDLNFADQEGAELWRLLGALELSALDAKMEVGTIVLELIVKKRYQPVRDAMVWALGRIGARELLHGPLNLVVPSQTTESWIRKILTWTDLKASEQFALMLLARKTGDRFRDISETVRSDVLKALASQTHLAELVENVSELDEKDEGLLFGESLPAGLKIQD